jgi:hypothetical protein
MERAPPYSLRPFGDAADLDLDFSDPDRAYLVTTLLAQCSGMSEPAFWWSQALGVRTAALLRLVALTERGIAHLPFTSRCAQASCGAIFEFELPLQRLAHTADATQPMRVELEGQRFATLRRPTAEDVRVWREAKPASRAEAIHTMIASLLMDGDVHVGDEAALSKSLAAQDPLVAFTVACACPACGVANEVAIDLEAVALGRLAARQRALLREVHSLASQYGWTESQVLAVPPTRRSRYLELIEDRR